MGEIEYLELAEQERNTESGYILIATVKHEENSAVIQFPTKELGDILESIGIILLFHVHAQHDLFIPDWDCICNNKSCIR